MKIEVLGTGCASCDALAASATAAADKLGIEYSLEHITDLNELLQRGVMLTPALALNGTIVLAGRVADHAELTTILSRTPAKARG